MCEMVLVTVQIAYSMALDYLFMTMVVFVLCDVMIFECLWVHSIGAITVTISTFFEEMLNSLF